MKRFLVLRKRFFEREKEVKENGFQQRIFAVLTGSAFGFEGDHISYDDGGIYSLLQGKIAAYVCDDRLLVKPVPAAREILPHAPMEAPYPGAKEMLLVEEVDDRSFLQHLLVQMEPQLPEQKKKKAKGK